MAGLGPLEILAANLVMFLGAAVQGSVGFGMALIAAPLLMLIEADFVPGPIVLAGLVLTGLMALRDRAHMDLGGLGWALAGRVPGTALGAAAVALLPAREMALTFGAVVLLGVVLSTAGLRVAIHRRSLFGTGALSGFMGTATSIGGPPMALLYQDATGPTLRGTLAGFFVAGTGMTIAALFAVDAFGVRELILSAVLVPGATLGFWVSGWATGFFDRGGTRPAVLGLSGGAAVVVIGRALLGS